MTRKHLGALVGLGALLLSSCMSTGDFDFGPGPRFRLEGVRTVWVLPFAGSGEGAEALTRQAVIDRSLGLHRYASGLDESLSSAFSQGLYQSLARSRVYREVKNESEYRFGQLFSGRRDRLGAADAFITGEIKRITIEIVPGNEFRQDPYGQLVPVGSLTKHITIEYTYRAIRSRDGAVLGEATRTTSASDKVVGRDAELRIKPDYLLANEAVYSALETMRLDLTPQARDARSPFDSPFLPTSPWAPTY